MTTGRMAFCVCRQSFREVPNISSTVHKLGLGGAQFGLVYGITNERGRIPSAEVAAIVDTAIRAGITTFDTAAAYGDSEDVLGGALLSHARVDIVSKLPAVAGDQVEAADIERYSLVVGQTLARLRRASLYGLLLHRPDDLRKKGGERIGSFLEELKRAGKVAKVGVSVYEPEQVSLAMERMSIDIVQAPVNLLDQRFLQKGAVELLRRRETEVHARSVFLQGALLAEPARLPPHFRRHGDRLAAIAAAARDARLSRLSLCLRFVLGQEAIDRVIVGVTQLAELHQIIAAAADTTPLPGGLAQLASDDVSLLNPSLWPS